MTCLPIQACNSILAYSPNWQQQIHFAIYTYRRGPAQTKEFFGHISFFFFVSLLGSKLSSRSPTTASRSPQSLSTHSLSDAILPDPRPPIFPNVPTADKPLKLLLPSLKFRDLLDLFNFEELMSPTSRSASSKSLLLATASRAMLLRQKGQTGGVRDADVGLGLLWQQRASVQCAHIWWLQSWTSIVHTCSKHMQHNSVSLASEISSSIPTSECDGDGYEYTVPFKMLFSLSLFASIKARSSRSFASSSSSLMNFKGDGQTRGSADDGFSRAAHAPCLCLKATMYGILPDASL